MRPDRPHRTWRTAIVASLALLWLSACGSSTGAAGGPQPLPPGGPPLIGIPNVLLPVKLTLPAGTGLSPTDLELRSAAGTARPGADGRAQVPVYDGGPQLIVVLGADDVPVLLGWAPARNGRPGPHPIDARTTAEVLVYLLGHAYLGTDDIQERLIGKIRTDPLLDDLAALVATSLAADPQVLRNGDATLLQGIHDTIDAVLATSGGVPELGKIDVEPDFAKSGISVRETGANQILIENTYARRCVALVERVAYGVEGAGETPSPAEVDVLTVQPVIDVARWFGVQEDDLRSRLGDYFRRGIPARERALPPLNIPLFPDDVTTQYTDYLVTILGPGNERLGATPADGTRRHELFLEVLRNALVLDFLMPSLAVGALPTTNGRVRNWIESLSPNDIAPVYDAARADTAGQEIDWAFEDGDVVEAAEVVLRRMTLDSAYRLGVASAFFDLLAPPSGGTPDARADYMKALYATVQEMIANLTQGDPRRILDTIAVDVEQSRFYEEFQVRVKRSRISLAPRRSSLTRLEFVVLQTTLQEADAALPGAVTYRWATTGNYGHLVDNAGNNGTAFDTSFDSVIYVPNIPSTGFGQDAVTVEALRDVGGLPESIGAAGATVEVKEAKPEIRPRRCALGNGDRQQFIVAMPAALAGPGTLSYRWTLVGTNGALQDGSSRLETTEPKVTYRCWSTTGGVDRLRVEVLSSQGGVVESLGQDEAEIRIEQGRKSIVYGTGTGRSSATWSPGWFDSCSGFETVTPKVAGAIRYDVHCYGFNDTAFWGTMRDYVIDPATYPEDGGAYWMGWSGGCGFGPYNGTEADLQAESAAAAVGWTNSERFAGMVVEVTVTYGN